MDWMTGVMKQRCDPDSFIIHKQHHANLWIDRPLRLQNIWITDPASMRFYCSIPHNEAAVERHTAVHAASTAKARPLGQ